MLTRKQQTLLIFIHKRLQTDGIPPSFDEMKDALELKSKSGIHRLITALEERGFIRRLPNRARALEVLKLPEGYGNNSTVAEAPRPMGFSPSVVSGGLDSQTQGTAASNVHAFPGTKRSPEKDDAVANDEESFGFSVPVMGRIAAGVPISAIQENTHNITVPPNMIGNGEHYALEVQGDSMIEEGIFDGDTVIVREASTATVGDIVVALVDDEEATLKRFRRQGDRIALEAANPAYETRVFSQNRVKVQGRLVGLIRNYH